MRREVYLWIAFFIAVMAIAGYFRFYYQPALALKMSLLPQAANMSSIYPYQRVSLPVAVNNTGSAAIENLSIGAYLNGNITTLYKIYLPAGKQEELLFNYTPTTPGVYSLFLVADPDHLYNLAGRSATQLVFNITVNQPSGVTPESLLPQNGIVSQGQMASSLEGFLVGSYLYGGYGVSSMAFSGPYPIYALLSPLLNISATYFDRLSIGYANYRNGSQGYALWMQGYIEPSVIGIAAESQGYPVTNVSSKNGTIVVASLNGNWTLCSWYSRGWIKLLFWNGANSCITLVNNSAGNWIDSPLYPRLLAANALVLANSTYQSGNSLRTSVLEYRNYTFLYGTIWANNTPSSKCNGIIRYVNGTDYCSQLLVSRVNSSVARNVSGEKTWASVGHYNLSYIALVNQSKLLLQSNTSQWLIQRLNLTGKSANFTASAKNLCNFYPPFSCSNVTFSMARGVAYLSLKNTGANALTLNNMGCYSAGAYHPSPFNLTMGPGQTDQISTQCYANGNVLQGLFVSLGLNFALNYTSAGTTNIVTGGAFINVVG